jgi:hypothetical protein
LLRVLLAEQLLLPGGVPCDSQPTPGLLC